MLRALDRSVLRFLPFWKRLKHWRTFRELCGFEETIWTRRQSDIETRKLVSQRRPENLSVLEVSGSVWRDYGFKSYQNVEYPEFDICRDTLNERFDLIIAEHVFEHLLWPYRAAHNVFSMLQPGGYFLMVCPFLYRVHPCPHDCSRWTETGMKYFLAEARFDVDETVTGSWGNRKCLKHTFRAEFTLFNRYFHAANNEPEYPIVVWALAQKPLSVPMAQE